MVDWKKFEQIQGSLASIRTPNSAARRRHPPDTDWDRLLAHNDPFAIDYTNILGSRAFARLAGKTEVETLPKNALVGTRLSHTLGIINTGVLVGKSLGLNVELVRAGTAGHDLGHPAFGHGGEAVLKAEYGIKFLHAVFGCVVAELEKLNLTYQTLLCILHHSTGSGGLTTSTNLPPEAAVVKFADKLFYLWSNIEDAYGGRMNIPFQPLTTATKKDIAWFGATWKERLARSIIECCLESAQVGFPSFTTSPAAQRFEAVKQAMYEHVYYSREKDIFEAGKREQARTVLRHLKDHTANPIAYFALLTDGETLDIAKTIDLKRDVDLSHYSAHEILAGHTEPIDVTNPDLDW